MTERHVTSVQGDALIAIYERQRRLKKPGTRSEEALESAKDYVLNRRAATVAPYLEHDATRDGYTAVRRRGRAELAAVREIVSLAGPAGGPARNEAISTNGHPGSVDLPPVRLSGGRGGGGEGRAGTCAIVARITPEDEVVGDMMREAVVVAIETQLGRRGVQVLSTMLIGKTIECSAADLGLSTDTVERYRARIRQIARPVLLEAVA